MVEFLWRNIVNSICLKELADQITYDLVFSNPCHINDNTLSVSEITS